MLIILFLVARNVVKLIMERRRKVFGAQIRTRLVVVFVSLSLIPTVIMFLASNRVVATSVDYWFTRQTETSSRRPLMWGKVFMRQRRNVCTAVPRRSLRKPHNGASLGRPPAPTRFFKQSKRIRPYPGRLCHAAGEKNCIGTPPKPLPRDGRKHARESIGPMWPGRPSAPCSGQRMMPITLSAFWRLMEAKPAT